MADVVIAGAGPAGATTALVLARAGVRVTMVDPCRPPALRAESLPFSGLSLAAQLGLTDVLRGAWLGSVSHQRLHWRAAQEDQSLVDQKPWLLSRAHLHAGLRSAALAAGARLLVDSATIAQDGNLTLRSNTDKRLRPLVVIDARGRAAGGLAPARPVQVALPFSAHCRAQAECLMTLDTLGKAWRWRAQTEDGRVFGALFCAPQDIRAVKRQALCRTEMSEIVLQKPCDATLRAAKTVFHAPNVLRIGDAGLARDPIGSHGVTHALRSALHAAAAARTLLDHPEEAGAARQFLDNRHRLDCKSAIESTNAAHAQRGGPAISATHRPKPPPVDTLLAFRARRKPVPCLTESHIRWVGGLLLPASGAPVAYLGGLPAGLVADLLDRPGTAAEMARRLSRYVPRKKVSNLLDYLLAEEALVPAEAAANAR